MNFSVFFLFERGMRMARLNINFDNELLKQVEKMAQVDVFAPKMIDEALPIIQKKLSENILNGHQRTGKLAKSIKIKKAKKIKNGGYVGTVSPVGNQDDGTSNAEELIYLEYGRKGQPATPVLSPAVASTQNEVMEKMQEVFDRELIK